MDEKYVLKDELFNIETVTELSNTIKSVYEAFDSEVFIMTCVDGFSSRELKERMTYISDILEVHLPSDFYHATEIMLKVCEKTNITGRFVYGAFSEYIEKHGCNETYLEYSLYMLGEYTKVFSAEFAIRKFINHFPEITFQRMIDWSKSIHVDQRRLASEGLRAKLPWAKKIDFDPIRAVEPLEYLYYDTERYVTRSVANHLNDLSKIYPELVIELLRKWKSSKKQNEDEMSYIINHSTRTLIKRCYPGALDLLGYKLNPKINVSDFEIVAPKLQIGESLEFRFNIEALEDSKLMIDYKIDYPMAKSKRSEKVFKIKKCTIKNGKSIRIQKKHPFKVMTTKKLYSGEYNISLQINGKLYDQGEFYLEV